MENIDVFKLFKNLKYETAIINMLFKKHGTLKGILMNCEAADIYHKVMIYVIKEKECQEGNYTVNGMTYTMNKDWSEIKKEYGGTMFLPFY